MPPSCSSPAASAAEEATDLPLCLDPPQRSAGGVDTDSAWLLDLIQRAPEGPISLAEALHVLHVHGRNAPLHRSDIPDTERSSACFSVWQALTTRSGGEVVPAE